MPYAVGDLVLVHSLGKGVVREVRKGGRCLVEIKGRSLLVDERQLSPMEQRRASAPAGEVPQRVDPASPSRARAADSIDLHGMTTDEAETALVSFVSQAILSGLPAVRVIHGRSGGRLKIVVHTRLKTLPSIRGFRLDPVNPGVTLVTL